MTEEQRARLAAKRPDIAVRREIGARRHRARQQAVEAVREHARSEVKNLIGDPFWVAGVVAYWAEGAKQGGMRFANSDAAMVRLFIGWSKRYLQASEDDFTIHLHLHDGQEESERIRFWAAQTGLHHAQFRKTFVKKEGTGHRKKILYNGTASVRLRRSVDALHKVMGWVEGLTELWLQETSSPPIILALGAGSSIGRASGS